MNNIVLNNPETASLITVSKLSLNHSLSMTNLLPGTTYYFSAEATDSSGYIISSNEGSSTTMGPEPDTDGDGIIDIIDADDDNDDIDTDGDGTWDLTDLNSFPWSMFLPAIIGEK